MYCFDFYKSNEKDFLTWKYGCDNLAGLYLDYMSTKVHIFSCDHDHDAGFELEIVIIRDPTSIIIADFFPTIMLDVLIIVSYKFNSDDFSDRLATVAVFLVIYID